MLPKACAMRDFPKPAGAEIRMNGRRRPPAMCFNKAELAAFCYPLGMCCSSHPCEASGRQQGTGVDAFSASSKDL